MPLDTSQRAEDPPTHRRRPRLGSPDRRFAYVFGRDGGLTKIDLETHRVADRIVQAGNSIGGAITKDGRLLAVANYEPGGVKLFDAKTLALLAEIEAAPGPSGKRSNVVGIADAPGNRFVFSLFEAEEIWVADVAESVVRIHRSGRGFSGRLAS